MYYNPYGIYNIKMAHYLCDIKYFGMCLNKLKKQKRGGYKRK